MVLDDQEWKALAQYIYRSEEQRVDVNELFKCIHQYRQDLSHHRFQIDQFREKHFKAKTKKQLQNVMSLLYQKVLDFLVSQELKDQSDVRDLLLHNHLVKKKLYAEAERVAKRSNAKSQSDSTLDLWSPYFNLHMRFHRLYNSQWNASDLKNRMALIKELIQAFRLWASQFSMTLASEFLLYQRLQSEPTDLDMHKELEPFILPASDLLSRVLEDQYMMLKLDFGHEPKVIYDTVVHQECDISEFLKQLFYSRLLSFYLHYVRQGNADYHDQLAEVILWSVSLDDFHATVNITSGRFISDISILCFIDRSETAEAYIKRNENYLSKEYQPQTIAVSRMMIDFSEGDFSQVQTAFNTTLFKDPVHKLHAYNNLLKAAYELGEESEDLFRHSRNLEAFISRNKSNLPKSLHSFFGHFNKGYRYLIKDRKKLADLLSQEIAIKDRKWLSIKLEE